MPRVHLLNMSPGDCTIIEHGSGRITMIDICCGNLETRQQAAEAFFIKSAADSGRPTGNYRMCERPSNPINYLKTFLPGKRVFRFVLTHPDMDHMDGLDALRNEIGIDNFWDTGARRTAPDFENHFRYKKEDWLAYEAIISGKTDVRTAQRLAGDRFAWANKTDEDKPGGDALYISAPNKDLLADPDENDDINESSYIVTYYSAGGRLVFPGDAHDVSWDYAIKHHGGDLANCGFLLAPHHGRDSQRSYDFLDHLNPKMTWLGCAPSEYIDYGVWDRKNLPKLMSNQTGNTVLEIGTGYYDIYVENEKFAVDAGAPKVAKNNQGYTFYKRVYTE